MTLLGVLALLLHVASGDSVKAVSGFHGEAVTLHSGADPSWNISTIEWSILSNNTFIATYRGGQTSINRFWRYKDRLSLNTATGDLTIRNLSEEDAIEYNLYLIYGNTQKLRSKTKLTVARRIQKPHLRKLLSGYVEGTCMIVMDCSSEGKAIEFSWQAQPSSSMRQSVCKKSSMLVLSVQDEVNVTCTVHNGVENASAVDTVRCSGDKPKPGTETGDSTTGVAVVYIIVAVLVFCGGFCLGRVYKTSSLGQCISKAFRRESNKQGGQDAPQGDLGNNNDKQGGPV